jgi:hypothetical protein
MSCITSNMTTAFVDLATYDEMEKYMYGGSFATAYFCRETKKSTWFTQVPVVLSRSSGECKFGNDWSVNISRAGDYLLNNWLTLTIAPTSVEQFAVGSEERAFIQWTPNLMHNLIRDCYISFNDLVAAQFNNFHLDFWASFTIPSSKSTAYNKMIGNTCHMLQPVELVQGNVLPGGTFHLPLPFFYTRDSGVALPTAALPYNDMKINFSFRDWSELITLWKLEGVKQINNQNYKLAELRQYCESENLNNLFASNLEPTVTSCNVWANYAIVSNDERKRMACAPRDILIEQVQWNTPQKVISGLSGANTAAFPTPSTTSESLQIRFAHAIKVLFFAIRNSTCPNYYSNYNTRTPMWGVYEDTENPLGYDVGLAFPGEASVMGVGNNKVPDATYVREECNGIPLNAQTADPLNSVTLSYESTRRLSDLYQGYYSMVNPYFNAPRVPVAEVSAGQTVSLGKVLAGNMANRSTPNCNYGQNGPSHVSAVACDSTECIVKDPNSNRVNTNYSDMIAGMAWGNYPTGVHCYSYSLDFWCLDPMGSTNYGKLTNISMTYTISNDASWFGSAPRTTELYLPGPPITSSIKQDWEDIQYTQTAVTSEKNTYEFLLSAVNNNIIRISGGALGFPVL